MEIDFEWSDHYLIGVEEIDVQHKRLILIMKGIFQLKDHGLSSLLLKKKLQELERYAEFHFKCEEQLMKVYSYPECEEQKAEHKEIFAQLRNHISQVNSENDISELLFFFIKWLVDHTRKGDRIMGKYINERREN